MLKAEALPGSAGSSAAGVHDLRSYLAFVEREFPGDVVHIEREVDAKFEVTALLLKLHRFKLKNMPILVFDRVRTVDGELSPMPVVVNVMANLAHIARFLGVEPEGVVNAMRGGLAKRVKPLVIDRAQAPCRQVVKTGDQVDLRALPALQAWNLDAGPYVNAGAFLVYDPDTGVDNSAIIRGWLKDRRTIPFYAQKHNHTAHIRRMYESRGQDMRAAFWVGHHAGVLKGGSTRIPYGDSHFEAMGGLLGQPLRLTGSETWGEDFLVPADAEVVIEGVVKPNEWSPEGPYGEDWGHTGAQRLEPFLEVTAITHRQDAMWLNFITGQSSFMRDRRQGDYRAIAALRVARSVSQNVLSIQPSSIRGGYYVQIHKEHEGEAMDIGMAVLSAVEGVKYAIVVDEDVNIDDDDEALWALGARTQWNDDVVIVSRGRSPGTDPSNPEEGVGAKVVIDATMPYPFEPRNSVSPEVLERVTLRDFLPSEFIESLPQRLFNDLPANIIRELR